MHTCTIPSHTEKGNKQEKKKKKKKKRKKQRRIERSGFFSFFLAFAGYTIRAAREMNEVIFSNFCLHPRVWSSGEC